MRGTGTEMKFAVTHTSKHVRQEGTKKPRLVPPTLNVKV